MNFCDKIDTIMCVTPYSQPKTSSGTLPCNKPFKRLEIRKAIHAKTTKRFSQTLNNTPHILL